MEWTRDGRDTGEDIRSAVGRAPSWFMACLLGQWMDASLPTSGSALASCLPDNGSPPPMPMGGGRSYLDKRCGLRTPRRLAASSSRRSGRSPEDLCDRCFNCLSYSHRVATCRLPRRCLHCHGFRHLARDCKQLRSAATTMAKGADLPRHSARGDRPLAPKHALHGGGLDGAMLGAMEGAGGKRWRYWRRRSKPARDINMGALPPMMLPLLLHIASPSQIR